MVSVPKGATDDQLLAIVRYWIDVLAAEDYGAVFSALGHAVDQRPDSIREAIKAYRSPDLYPGVEDFKVTSWKTASGGNPRPLQKITRFKPNDTGLLGAVEVDLPLNGRWSDLEADFVWFEARGGEHRMSLEEIGSSSQRQREFENAP